MIKKITILFCLITAASWSQEEIIKNHSFENELEDWKTSVWVKKGKKLPIARFKPYDRNGQDNDDCFRAMIVSTSEKAGANSVTLRQLIGPLKRGKKYNLSFWVKSKIPEDKVTVSIYSNKETGSKDWGLVFSERMNFTGDGEWKNVSSTFVAKPREGGTPADLKKLAIKFGLGTRKGLLYIDNISLKRIK